MQRRGNATDPRDKEASLAELQRRVPPQNIEAERAVLGSIMLFSELLHSILGVLKAKDFYLERHQWIFEAILEQESENLPLDIISVANRLKSNGHLEKLGGIAYLGELVDMIPSAAHIEHYAKIIHDKSILRQIITVCTEIASEAYEELEQVDLFLDSAEKRFFEIRQEGQNKDIAPVSEIVKNAFATIEKLYGRKELVTGVPTGFEEFDKLTSGLQPTDLIILAGRPAMGKTSLAMNMVANASIHHKVPVVVFSLEMSKEQLVMRMLCSEGRVDASRLRTGNMKDTDIPRLMQAATELARSKIFIDDSANSSLLEMRSKCRRLKMEHGLGMIMIDYLQLMKGGDQGGDSREREISDISRGLKALAKELHVPVIALSQLNRSLERRPDKRPMPSDLRECVAGDTHVALADGRQVPIRDLVGQSPLVLAISKEGKVVEAQSDVVWCVGKRPLFEIELASGRTIQATAEHRFLSAKGWVCTHQLHPEDRIGIVRQLPSPPTRRILKEHAEILDNQEIRDPAQSDIFWDKVVRVLALPEEQDVFDLSVPSASSWIGNDIFLHNSGALEQDADMIVFVYRDEVYNPETEDRGIAEIIIGKQRNGPTGTARVRFFHEYTKFENLFPDQP